MENIDRKLLIIYSKPQIQQMRKIVDILLDRFCLRIRLPSLEMEVEISVKSWLTGLRRSINLGINKNVRQNEKDTLDSIIRS